MFYFLSRIFAWVAEPLAYIFICFILAVFLPAKFKRTKLYLAIIAIAMSLIFSNPMLYTYAERSWCPTDMSQSDTTHYDYGVVLGGFGHYDNNTGNIDYHRAIDRLFTAVRYYRQGRIDYILLTGDGLTTDSATFYREMQQLFAIPPQALIREPLARSTRENAQYTARLLQQHNDARIVVFTSAIHMPRTQLTFSQEGVSATYIPCDFRSRSNNFFAMWFPSPKVLADWGDLIHEWVGCVVYRLFH